MAGSGTEGTGRHRITFDIDPIERRPRLDHETVDEPGSANEITVFLPVSPEASIPLHHAASYFGWINPHVTLTFSMPEDEDLSFEHEATEPDWTKCKPTDPTSAHWYDVEALKTLIAAEVSRANRNGSPQRPVREFVSEFRGLSGTTKRRVICEALGASRESLDAFFRRGDAAIRQLLAAMKAESKPVKARDLGVIGEDHVREMLQGGPSTERYKRMEVDVGGVPYLIEAGFGHCPEDRGRTMVTGLNWSISVGGDPFHHLGVFQSLGAILAEQRASPHEPIAFFLHVATPRPTFLDRGKSTVDLPRPVNEAIVAAVKHVTAVWAKQRKAEERDKNASLRRLDALTAKSKSMTIKDAAYAVMPHAYAAASDNGALPANARQIYYAARPEVLRLTGKDTLDAASFTQRLLIDFINEHPNECSNWNVVFSDRGHFTEPHTGHRIGLGTLSVRQYIDGYDKPALIEGSFCDPQIDTCGPDGRFGAVLYIEKEGFEPLLDQSKIAERFDLALMSCKGMSVTASPTGAAWRRR